MSPGASGDVELDDSPYRAEASHHSLRIRVAHAVDDSDNSDRSTTSNAVDIIINAYSL